jgi:hypothetical protein
MPISTSLRAWGRSIPPRHWLVSVSHFRCGWAAYRKPFPVVSYFVCFVYFVVNSPLQAEPCDLIGKKYTPWLWPR